MDSIPSSKRSDYRYIMVQTRSSGHAVFAISFGEIARLYGGEQSLIGDAYKLKNGQSDVGSRDVAVAPVRKTTTLAELTTALLDESSKQSTSDWLAPRSLTSDDVGELELYGCDVNLRSVASKTLIRKDSLSNYKLISMPRKDSKEKDFFAVSYDEIVKLYNGEQNSINQAYQLKNRFFAKDTQDLIVMQVTQRSTLDSLADILIDESYKKSANSWLTPREFNKEEHAELRIHGCDLSSRNLTR